MKLRRITRRVRERLLVLAGRVPNCRWVRLRLGAYHNWDPSLSRLQFNAVEKHLTECPECRAEWEKTAELCHNLERLRRGLAGKPGIEEQVARLMSRIHERESERATFHGTWANWLPRRGYKLAAVCLFLIALPMIIFIGRMGGNEYFWFGESGARLEYFDYTYWVNGNMSPSAILTAVCLLIVLLASCYIGFHFMRKHFRLKYSAAGMESLACKNSVKTSASIVNTPVAEKPDNKDQSKGEGGGITRSL